MHSKPSLVGSQSIGREADSAEGSRCLSSLRLDGGIVRLESETGRARHVAPLACGLQSFERSLRGAPGKRILLASWYGAGNLGDKLLMCFALERMSGEISRLTTVLLGR